MTVICLEISFSIFVVPVCRQWIAKSCYWSVVWRTGLFSGHKQLTRKVAKMHWRSRRLSKKWQREWNFVVIFTSKLQNFVIAPRAFIVFCLTLSYLRILSIICDFRSYHCVLHCTIQPTGCRSYNKRLTYLLTYCIERPLHSMEIVADVLKKWSTWPEEFCRGVHLCAKRNYVYVNISSIVSSTAYLIKSVVFAAIFVWSCWMLFFGKTEMVPYRRRCVFSK